MTPNNSPKPPPPAGIPLRKLIRDERVRHYLQIAIFFVLLPGGFLAMVFAIESDASVGSCLSCCIAPAFLILFVVGLFSIAKYSPDITDMMLTEQLTRYGKLDEMLTQMETELADLSRAFVRGRITADTYGGWPDCWVITDRWLIRLKHRDLRFVPLDDLLWVHKRISVIAGLLWRDTFYRYLCVVTDRGLDQKIPLRNDAESDLLLQEMVTRRPQLLYGYFGEAQDLFRQGKPAMRAQIARRHQQWESASEDDREVWLEDALRDATECMQRVEVA